MNIVKMMMIVTNIKYNYNNNNIDNKTCTDWLDYERSLITNIIYDKRSL